MNVRKPKTFTAAAATTIIKTTKTMSAIFIPFRTVQPPPVILEKREFSSLEMKVKSVRSRSEIPSD
jgi:hypothetical protein